MKLGDSPYHNWVVVSNPSIGTGRITAANHTVGSFILQRSTPEGCFSVYLHAGGLRTGGLLPLGAVAGGVGASLQGVRRGVEAGEPRHTGGRLGPSGLLTL